MIPTLMSEMRKTFGYDQDVFIGAPLESDHQLGNLFHQNIIACVFTIDGDVIAFGEDVIKSLESSGKCKLVVFAAVVKKNEN